jgi:hypothetical protein
MAEYDAYDYQNVPDSNYDAYDYQYVPSTSGDQEFMNFMTEAYKNDPANSASFADIASKAVSALGEGAGDFLKKYLYNPTTGKVNLAGLGTAGMALYKMMNKGESGGYNKPVPNLTASRQQIQYNDPNRVAGSAGRQYFTDTKYDGTDPAVQAQGILAAYRPAAAPAPNPYAGTMARNFNTPVSPQVAPSDAASNVSNVLPVPEAQGFNMGGIAQLAKGRYLDGKTDGMADELRTNIDGKQAAALSHGEFVIPADVVSHLGNGNSEAGAEKLYQMMARIRKARTGNEKQGKEIDANKFLPGGVQQAQSGGLMGYAGGGVVNFNTGGVTTTPNPTTGGGGVPSDVSRTSTLSPWVGDYVTTALGEGAAAAAQPYQAYTGPLTAGPSNLQQQAFAGSSEIAQGGFTPTQFTSGTFGSEQAQQYMNPYLKNVLDPQMAELKRQADITRSGDAARLAKAGAYGGGRQAIMESEGNRNLLTAQNTALGQGYSTAYDKAMGQFNTEQGRGLEAQKATEQSRQSSAEFGLKSLADLARQGEVQRGITSEGLAADRAQFEEQRDYGMKLPQYKLNLLQGLPIGANTTAVNQDAIQKLTSQMSGLGGLYAQLEALGQVPAATPPKA